MPPRKYHGKCVEKQFTQAKCVIIDSSKIENKTRGEGSDLAPLRIGLRYRAWKIILSLAIWKLQDHPKNYFIFIFKISQSMIEEWMRNGRSRRKNEN